MNAARDLAQVVLHAAEAGCNLRDLFFDVVESRRNSGRGGTQPKRERDKTLLHAVVQISLDSPTRQVGSGNDARAGG